MDETPLQALLHGVAVNEVVLPWDCKGRYPELSCRFESVVIKIMLPS